MSEILSRGDVINSVAAQVDLPQAKVDAVVKAYEGTIARALKDGSEVRLAGFGTFKTSLRAARTSRNPRTGEPIDVPERIAPKFSCGKSLVDAARAIDNAPAPAKAAPKGKAAAKPAAKAETKAAPAAKATKADAPKAPAKKGAAKKK